MATIGDRIKLKRKELGLTQVELGAKIHVTDRAVSKWEQNEGNPDMSIVASLSSVLGVSLDYLILGKEEEIFSIDDMDTEKRALYLAKKDDADNFVKYKYDDVYILFDSDIRGIILNIDTKPKYYENLRKTIIENKSYKIFSILLDKFVNFCSDKKNERIMQDVFSGAFFVKSYLDDFVIMASSLQRIDVLDLIKFKWFKVSIGSQSKDKYDTFSISDETLSAMLENASIADYLSDIEFLLLLRKPEYLGRMKQIPIVGSQVNSILNYFYKKNDKKHIDYILNRLYNNLHENTKGYQDYNTSEAFRSGYRDCKRVYSNGVCYSYCASNGYEYYSYYAAVPLISAALSEAEKDLNVDMIILFNDYNKEVGITLKEKVHVLNDEDIRLFKIKANPNSSQDERVIANYSRYGICDYKALMKLASFDGFEPSNADSWRKIIPSYKSIFDNYVKNTYISYMEMFEDCVYNKDYKTLFKFSTDYKLSSLEEPIIDCNDKEIIEKAREIFTPNKTICSKIATLEEKEKAIKDQRYREYELKSIRESKLNMIKSLYDGEELISDMLKWQYSIIPFQQMNEVSSFKDLSNALKKDYLDSLIKEAEDKIESITHDKALQEEYDNTVQIITEEYLSNLLQGGSLELFIIKLCVRMDVVLKYKRYEGEDFFSRMDAFFKKNVPSSRECDDGWGYSVLDKEFEEKEVKPWQRRRDLFNRLRMQRNNIAHSDNNNVKPLTQDELQECMKFVLSM